MCHQRIISVALSFILLGIFAVAAKAQDVTPDDLTTDGQGILPKSGNIEVFGLNMDDSNSDTHLVSITIRFEAYDDPDVPGGGGWTFADSDIERVAVYADNQGYREDGNGEFSVGDTCIAETTVIVDGVVTVDCTDRADTDIPNDDNDTDLLEYDFFVVINTSDTIRDDDPSTFPNDNEGHAFTISMRENDIEFDDGTFAPDDDEGGVNPIYCEAWGDDELPISLCYYYRNDYMYPGNRYNDWNRYPYSVPDEWIRPRYDNEPTDYEEYYPGWPLSQLLPMETRTAVLGIDCAGGVASYVTGTPGNPVYLESVTVTFTDLNGAGGDFDPTTGLDRLYDYTDWSSLWPFSGVALYKDTDDDGVWIYDPDDIVPVSFGAGWVPAGGGVWTLTLSPQTVGGEEIEVEADGLEDDEPGFDYFIVLRADSGNIDESGIGGDGVAIKFGSTFTVRIDPGDMHFSDRPAQDEDENDTGLLNNPSQPYITAVKPIHSVIEIHDLVADPDPAAIRHVQRIDATSPATPIFGLNVTDTTDSNTIAHDGGEVLSWVTVYLHNVSGTDTSDFASLSTDETSGLSIWIDNKTAGDRGVFDSQDTPIQVEEFAWQSAGTGVWSATLNNRGWNDVYGEDVYTADNRGDDYFICIRTSDTLSYNNRFYFEIEDGDVQLAHQTNATGSGVTGRTLTANFPVLLTDLTSSGQTIEPLSSATPVIGINTWDDTGNGGKLEQFIVEFYNPGGVTDTDFDPRYDLLPLATATGGGVAIYQDSAGGTDGVFDSTDTVIPLSEATWNVGVTGQPYFQCKLVLATPLSIPTNNTTSGNVGADYFIVIRTADESTYEYGDDFSVGIVSWGYEEDYLGEPATWGSRALGFIDGTGQQSRSYERIETNTVGEYCSCGNGTCQPQCGETESNCPGDCPSPPPEPEGPGSLKGCFIATACYGTPMAKEVRVLSHFRDEYLMTNSLGRFFVRTYYKISPQIASFISEHPYLKTWLDGI